MQKNLCQTIGLISNSSTQLAPAAEEMSAVTAQFSDGLGRQNQEIHRTQQLMQEIEQMIDAILSGSALATKSMQESCDGAKHTLIAAAANSTAAVHSSLARGVEVNSE